MTIAATCFQRFHSSPNKASTGSPCGLEYASSSLAETQEDMTTAYSGLMDTDMASEMTEYTQQNILEQAAVSVLSQANDIPQQVLSLLQK